MIYMKCIIIADPNLLLTESMVGDEQSGFRKGRGCMDKVFVVR